MIKVDLTVREAVLFANQCDNYGGDEGRNVRDRIIKALELATGNEKLLVACNGVAYTGQFWDQKIPAIKSLRFATGMGLKDAKDWIEEVQYHSKTIFTKPLDPEAAHKLCEELGKCGCSCWTTNA